MPMPKYTVVISADGKEHIHKLTYKLCGDCLYFNEAELCDFRDMMIPREKTNMACGDWKARLPIPEVVVNEEPERDEWEPAPQEIIDMFNDDIILEETNHEEEGNILDGDDVVLEDLEGSGGERGADSDGMVGMDS